MRGGDGGGKEIDSNIQGGTGDDRLIIPNDITGLWQLKRNGVVADTVHACRDDRDGNLGAGTTAGDLKSDNRTLIPTDDANVHMSKLELGIQNADEDRDEAANNLPKTPAI